MMRSMEQMQVNGNAGNTEWGTTGDGAQGGSMGEVEQGPKGDEVKGDDFPPFDPEMARRLYERDKTQYEEMNNRNKEPELAYDPTLYNNLSEYLAAQEAAKQRDRGRNERESEVSNDENRVGYDRQGEDEVNEGKDIGEELRGVEELGAEEQNRILMAAADSLVDKLNIHDVNNSDQVMFRIQERAEKTGESVLSILNNWDFDADIDKDNYGAVDLRNAFIDLASTYVMSRAEEPGAGAVQGVMNKMDMLVECQTEEPNAYLDEVQLNRMFMEPIFEDYLRGQQGGGAAMSLYDYLNERLVNGEANLRVARRRGERVAPEARRQVQAIRSTMKMLRELLEEYRRNMELIGGR